MCLFLRKADKINISLIVKHLSWLIELEHSRTAADFLHARVRKIYPFPMHNVQIIIFIKIMAIFLDDYYWIRIPQIKHSLLMMLSSRISV